VEKYGRSGQAASDYTICRMNFECWKIEATKTHSDYVILIAFPLPQWLQRQSCSGKASLVRVIAILFSYTAVTNPLSTGIIKVTNTTQHNHEHKEWTIKPKGKTKEHKQKRGPYTAHRHYTLQSISSLL